jgi:hypothetical protein
VQYSLWLWKFLDDGQRTKSYVVLSCLSWRVVSATFYFRLCGVIPKVIVEIRRKKREKW